jgi:DNA (cytosine-5)-methyltransferase 1
MNYYNEHDPKAAAWLRELIAGGHIPAGVVDERSITEISPDELSEYTQCHFFAGIGGWSLALELAGWPASRPVWTGSCPCQPFSSAGEGKGASDDRHLWPVFRRLIAKLHPERVFGEQVAQAIGFNWLDGVSADLEADGYEVGAVVLGAHSVGAPHIRQRLFWLANSNSGRREQRDANLGAIPIAAAHGAVGGLAVASHNGTGRDTGKTGGRGRQAMDAGATSLRQAHGEAGTGGTDPRSASGVGGLGDTSSVRSCGGSEDSGRESPEMPWAGFDLLDCLDGKSRRVESGTFPLAHGLSGRVGLLRGYGNAIVPQVAAEFIRAATDLNEWNTR